MAQFRTNPSRTSIAIAWRMTPVALAVAVLASMLAWAAPPVRATAQTYSYTGRRGCIRGLASGVLAGWSSLRRWPPRAPPPPF